MILEIYLAVEQGYKVVEYLAVHVAQGEFVLGVLADEGDPLAAGGDIVLMDARYGLIGQLIDAVVIQDDAVAP